MFDFAENTKDMTASEILSHYRNLYHAEPQTTERGIVANAINDYFAEVVQRRNAAEKVNAAVAKPVTRRSVLEDAIKCVCTDRNQQYGEPEDNFAVIAGLWSNYTGEAYSAHDVAMMMALFKVGRIMTGVGNADSYVDACGYLACAAEIGLREGDA